MLHQNIIHVKTYLEFNTGYLLHIIQTLRAQFPIFMYMYDKLMYMQVSKCLVCACIFEFIILLQVKFPINICLYFEVDHINDQIVWPSTKTSLLNWFLSTLSRLPCRLSLQNVVSRMSWYSHVFQNSEQPAWFSITEVENAIFHLSMTEVQCFKFQHLQK